MAKETQWNEQVDVLVVGSGFAGLTAAIEARESGKNVVVIEKMKSAGGNSIISDGGIAAPDTKLQKKWGIEDSAQMMYDDMLKAGLGLNHPRLVHAVVSNARSAFEWTIDTLHVPYLDRVDLFGGHSVARCYTPEGVTGGTILKKMLQRIDELGIPILYSTSFRSIITDAEGRVVGGAVLKEYDYKTDAGIPANIRTRRGILLASGGYGADVVFRSIQDPRLDEKIQTTNKPFATAEVLKSALKIGAASVQLSHIQLGAWSSPDEHGFGHGPLFADYILFQYGMIVDPHTGKRFVNELGDRKQSADAILRIGHPCIGIADDKAVACSGWDLSKAVRKGVVKKFGSMEELAAAYALDAETLHASVDRYNGFVRKGVDDDFRKPIVEEASPIVKAPFYAMRLWPKVHFTMGGLSINERAQVLDFNGNAIDGLYAAGEVAGGVHGASRLGSCAITECIVFGRIAGQNI
ncbi:flavocytochrome c [Anaerotalea alkaliphila]|uniref:Flavocytochrome c n=1 Tax=Anaerotalea alkaliphila TaxID=2662126 RepID=A0A7X5KPP1_9FIRM|nr:flavocytochrome c [Anaerotalea alkaliphila]NDL68477.1 flavocytochrome c [Anaerotalea alkaliphila]